MSVNQRSTPPKKHLPAAISLFGLFIAGIASKLYEGPASTWVNDSFAGAIYVIFWCVFASVFFPRTAPLKIAAVVVAATCGLEFVQLWSPPFLEYVRNIFLGRALLGNSFARSDFPYYVLGGGIGWFWISHMRREGG